MKKNPTKHDKQEKKKNLAEATTDDFFNQDFENLGVSDDEADESDEMQQKPTKKAAKSSKKAG